jgi:hypothetical protein
MRASVSSDPMCGLLVSGFSFTMLNEQMLKDAFAYLLTIPPNVKYVENFRKTVSFF